MKRLTDKEMFDRTFRLRRAVQLNLTKEILPSDQWTSVDQVVAVWASPPFLFFLQSPSHAAQDVPYLWRHLEAIAHEQKEKANFDVLLPEQLLGATGAGPPESSSLSSTTMTPAGNGPSRTEERLAAAVAGSGGSKDIL